jgi:uncharacterized protein
MKSSAQSFKNAVKLFVIILLIWGFYRALFKLPESIEELILKPLIWLGPTLYFVAQEKAKLSSIGVTQKNLFQSLYLGIGLGMVFGVIAYLTNIAKYGGTATLSEFGFNDTSLLAALGISVVTAVSEETVFRGYILSRFAQGLKDNIMAIILTTIGWVIIHLPILIFVHHLSLEEIIGRSLLTAAFGFGSAVLFARTQNITASILLSIFWSWPILLFR